MKHKPNFLVVGASKSGTTALVYYLSQHKDIYFPSYKEPRYFIKDLLHTFNDKDPLKNHLLKTSTIDNLEYSKLYNVKKKFRGDASVHYLNEYKTVIPKVKKELGDVPIFICIRNPINRLISHYNYNKNYNLFTSIEDAINMEEQLIDENYNSFWYIKDSGLYFEKIRAYKNSFSNVNIIVFENFIKNPLKITNNCLKKLSLPTLQNLDTTIPNPTKEFNVIYKILKKIIEIFIDKKTLSRIGNLKFIVRIKTIFKIKSKTTINRQTRTELVKFFEKDVNKLKSNYKLNLKFWRNDFNSI